MTLRRPVRVVAAIALGLALASLPFVQYRCAGAHSHERNAP
jgi:hypothetical protein